MHRKGRISRCGYNGGSLRKGSNKTMMTRQMESELRGKGSAPMMPGVSLTTGERALLRLLVSGRPLEEAAPALGLSLPDAERLLTRLQSRCGVPSLTRLLVLAVLNAWVR